MGMIVRTIDGQIKIPLAKHEGAVASLAKHLGYAAENGAEAKASTAHFGKQNEFTAQLVQFVRDMDFEPDEDYAEAGTVTFDFYHGKEDPSFEAFAHALAGFATEDSSLIWLGEEGDIWRWYYTAKRFYMQSPKLEWPEIPYEEEGSG